MDQHLQPAGFTPSSLKLATLQPAPCLTPGLLQLNLFITPTPTPVLSLYCSWVQQLLNLSRTIWPKWTQRRPSLPSSSRHSRRSGQGTQPSPPGSNWGFKGHLYPGQADGHPTGLGVPCHGFPTGSGTASCPNTPRLSCHRPESLSIAYVKGSLKGNALA